MILEWSDTRRADWGPIKLNVTQSLADSGKCLCRMINALAHCVNIAQFLIITMVIMDKEAMEDSLELHFH